MLLDQEIIEFFQSDEFDEMLVNVGNDDMIGYKNNNDWLHEHPATAIIFEKNKDTWNTIRSAYHSGFADLVIGDLPPEISLIDALGKIYRRMKNVEWNIEGSS